MNSVKCSTFNNVLKVHIIVTQAPDVDEMSVKFSHYILSGTEIPNSCMALLMTCAVIEASIRRSLFLSWLSAEAMECSA